jgi:hypothetical protein
MAKKTATDILGLEYDWLGCDAENHIALFSTAGGGYAPESFLRDTDAHHDAISIILASPARTTARFSPDLAPEAKNTWRLMAERGIFAYDSDVFGGPYQLVAAPLVSALLTELPEGIAKLVEETRIHPAKFVDLPTISVDSFRNLLLKGVCT